MSFEIKTMLARIKKHLGDHDISLQRQNNAYSNYVYLITSNKGKYIYKEYTKKKPKDARNIEVEIQQQLGFPQILHLEHDYRIERYYENDFYSFKGDLKLIAVALRQLHNTEVECEETQMDFLNNLIQETKRFRNDAIINELAFQFHKLFAGQELRLCHNDLQIGNMLKINNEIRFIDFEYACKGSIHADIANLFCESMADYDTDSIFIRDRGYTREEQILFLQIYFEREDVGDELLKVDQMEGYWHFYWFLWAASYSDDGPSGSLKYDEYARNRLEFLVELKILDQSKVDYLMETFVKKINMSSHYIQLITII